MSAAEDNSDWKDEASAAGAEVDASLDSATESGVDAGTAGEGYVHYVPAEEADDADEEGGEEASGFGEIPSDLKSLRKLIDQKNKSMVRLLNRRAGYALKIAEVKRAGNLPIRDDARERQVLEKVSRYNKGPLSNEALHRIFNCIMEEHRRLEEEQEERKDAAAGSKEPA
jgi:chorismate mutase